MSIGDVSFWTFCPLWDTSLTKEKIMENKYLNEAIIGNKNMIATFTEKGELQRMYFPK